ncbi:MAG: PD-(D/E)XK nuclease family protein, partial [Candidatus Hadarchaeales archaeon]
MTEYSHSRLTTFENCPMAYKLKYIVRLELEEGFETVEAFMGSRVHEALRRLYEDLMHEKLLSLEEL